MRIAEPRRIERDEEVVLEAVIEWANGDRAPLWFAYPKAHTDLVATSGEAFLAAALQPAMAAGESLQIDTPVSERLLSGLDELQKIFAQWFGWRRVEIRAEIDPDPAARISGNEASFFSLGVDSWHTLLTNRSTLTHLVYMRGLEWPLSRSTGNEAQVIERASRVAETYGKVLISGSTNLRDVFGLDWASQYFGAGLAAVALSMNHSAVRIASDHRFTELYPRGSTPMTDHWFSSERVRIIHDGADASRVQKVAGIVAEGEAALSEVRVCTYNSGGPDNCGRCEKCTRTMTALALLGRPMTPAFPRPLRLRDVRRRLRVARPTGSARTDRAYLEELHGFARMNVPESRLTRLIARKWAAALAAEFSERRADIGLTRSLTMWAVGAPVRWASRLKEPLRPVWDRMGRLQRPIRRLVGREILGR
jgi:hypothetical protein